MKINRDFLTVVMGRLIIAVVGLVSIRAVTTFLSPEEYGTLALLLMVQSLCGLFFINPVGQYINRHTHEWWEEGTLLTRLSPYRMYVVIVAIIGAIVMFFVAIASGNEYPLLNSAVLMLMVIAATWNATWIPRLNALGFRLESVAWGAASVISGLLLSISLMIWRPDPVLWYFGQALGMLIGAVGAGMLIRKYALAESHSKSALPIERSAIISFCLPLALGTGFMWLQLSGYRFVVEAYWGLAQLGYIAVGLMLASQIWTVAESLAMQFLSPYFFKAISDNNQSSGSQALSDLLNILGPLYLILMGGTVLFAPILVFLLVDEKFSDAVQFVMMGAAVECCRALANVFGNAAQVTRKTLSLALPYASGAIVLLALLLTAGINEGATIWVGISLVCGALVMLLVMIRSMHRQVKFTLGKKVWFTGAIGMTFLCGSSYMVGQLLLWEERAGAILVSVLISIALIGSVLRNNRGLKRLMQVRLSGEGR